MPVIVYCGQINLHYLPFQIYSERRFHGMLHVAVPAMVMAT